MKSSDSKESARACVIENAVEAMTKNQDVVIVHRTYQSVNDPVVIPSNHFIESVSDVEYLTEMHQAIRSWFCCYIPEEIRTCVHGPGIERSTQLYQDIDEFISNLIVAAAH